MVAEIGAALQGAKALKDTLASAVSIIGEHKRAREFASLNEVLLSAQQHALQLGAQVQLITDENDELKREIVDLKKWREDEDSYELREVATGIFAYLERGQSGPIKSAKKYCPECFQNMKSSILQLVKIPQGRRLQLKCSVCGTTPDFRHFSDTPVVSADAENG